jgi:hypothetical protein
MFNNAEKQPLEMVIVRIKGFCANIYDFESEIEFETFDECLNYLAKTSGYSVEEIISTIKNVYERV